MFRPLAYSAMLVAVALAGLATPAAADEACAPVPDDSPVAVCVEPEMCSSLGFCVDPTEPSRTAKDLVQFVKDQFGPCTCDPQPTPI